jgi:hypothetical protein
MHDELVNNKSYRIPWGNRSYLEYVLSLNEREEVGYYLLLIPPIICPVRTKFYVGVLRRILMLLGLGLVS